MILWGIDPASKKIAMVGWNGKTMDAYIAQAPKTDRGRELFQLRAQVEQIIKPEDTVFIEEPVLAGVMNIRTTILIAESVGMLLGLAAKTYVVPVSSWKKATVGSGNAGKKDVADWVRQAYPAYPLLHGDQDICDAAAICSYGRQVVEEHRRPLLSG